MTRRRRGLPASGLWSTAEELAAARHVQMAAERAEWIKLFGTAGWAAEQTRRRAWRLSRSQWIRPAGRALAVRVLATAEQRRAAA